MNWFALIGLLLALVGWVLFGLTGVNLLSGYLEDRTCQTDCVKNLFFSGVGVGVAGLLLSILAFLRPQGRIMSGIALLLIFPLCAIFGTLFFIGNYG